MINNLIKLFDLPKPYALKNQSTVYNFNKSNNVSIGPVWQKTVTSLLIAYFNLYNCLISKPVFTFSPQGVKIHILYYKPLMDKEHRREIWTEITRPEKEWKINLRFGARKPKTIIPRLILSPITFWDRYKILNLNSKISLRRGLSKYPGAKRVENPVLLKTPNYTNTVGRKIQWGVGIPTENLKSNINSWKGRLLFLPGEKLNEIAVLLSKLLQTNVQLEVVPLKYPYHDSNILAQCLVINSENRSYGKLKKQLFEKAAIFTFKDKNPKPLYDTKSNSNPNSEISDNKIEIKTLGKREIVSRLTGIKVRIGGRLAKQRVVPKRSVKSTYKGLVAETKTNIVDSSIFTSKNKKGAFSIRVWTSHRVIDK